MHRLTLARFSLKEGFTDAVKVSHAPLTFSVKKKKGEVLLESTNGGQKKDRANYSEISIKQIKKCISEGY